MVLLSLTVDAAVFEIEPPVAWSTILQAEFCSSSVVLDEIILGFKHGWAAAAAGARDAISMLWLGLGRE